MSGPYRPAYPGNGSTGNQPVSFKTDINRKKTKKWVAAKSYSYDGDDWGDDDDEEDELEEEEEVPPLPSTSRLPSSTAHQPLYSGPAPSAVPSQSPTNILNQSVESPRTQSPTFVRPADICKQMQEGNGSIQGSTATNPASSEVAPASAPAPIVDEYDHQNTPSQHSEETARSASPLIIPEVKRLSGFGEDFLGGTSNPAQSSHASEAQVVDQGSSLHHNPSLGFTSVVHQAFDVPETPSSTAGNFSRSNSDSTSIISPIVGPWKSETDKTPTITEDPMAEASAQEPPLNFKPGHRRDLSIPSPGNGPDRIPIVTHPEESQSTEASLSSPRESLTTPDHEYAESMVVPGEATPRPLSSVHATVGRSELEPTSRENGIKSSEEIISRGPTPLQIPEEHAQNIPQIVPSLSTETSPQDLESDRLRKEIMRSFSSEHVSALDAQAEAQNGEYGEYNSQARQSTYLPSEYDSYWNDQQSIPPTNPLQLRPTAPPAEPSNPTANQETAINPNDPTSGQSVSKPRHTLKKRFSWEASDDSDVEDVLEEPPAPVVPSQPVQPISGAETVTSENTISVPLSISNQSSAENTLGAETALPIRQSSPDVEKETVDNLEERDEKSQGELSYVPPVAEPQVSALTESEDDYAPPQTQPLQPRVDESSLPAFRKILEIPSSSEKIRVFNETREQFAAIESGLSDWIRRSSESLPEHADLIRANGRLPGGTPTSGLPPKTKFPKLSSLGNLSLPSTSHSDASTPGGISPTHARRSSGPHITGVMNRQNVELKGKDLLHSAGVLGGKAGGAARGLFAKGKSKLRGADKLYDSNKPASLSLSSRYSLQPVPRIPSLKLGDSKPFRHSFDGEHAFSRQSRPFSVDFESNLRSVAEERVPTVKPASPSSLRRAMSRFDNTDDEYDVNGESASAKNRSSSAIVSNGGYDSDQEDGSKEDKAIHHPNNGHRILGRYTFLNADSEQASESSLDRYSNPRDQEQTMPAVSPSVISSELSPSLTRGISHSRSQVSKLSEDGNNPEDTPRIPNSAATESVSPSEPKPLASVDKSVNNPVLPPLPQDGKLRPVEYNSRRDSINSKVSAMSEDEMDRIREKFDEEGLYSGPRESSPTRSQVSDMTDEDDEDDDEYDALREKLDEAGYQMDPEKDDAWQHFPRPPTGSPRQNQQPIRVVKMARVAMNKHASQKNEDDTKRYSRFSFEGEGNTLAEAMLENGRGKPATGSNESAVGLSPSQIPVTMGEDAPDEPPPPFPDPEASYGEDHKQQTEEERPAYNHAMRSLSNGDSQPLQSNEATRPPIYRPIHQQPAAAASHDTTSRIGRLQELRTNRNSIASSVSSISSPTVSSNLPRTAISPEPQYAKPSSQTRWGQDLQAPKTTQQRSNVATAVTDRLGRSLWANGRISNRAHARTVSDNLSGSGSDTPSIFSGRREHSLGSSDSIAVQAALSRNDLLPEPSPLHQSSDVDSDHSSHARLSTQFRNRMKFMGKKSRDAAANAQPAEREVETKPAEKKKEKNPDGKRGGFSRFSGIFNRPGANPTEREQRAERNTPSPLIHQHVDRTPRHASPSRNPQPAVYKQATSYQQVPSSTISYNQYPPMPEQSKPLPPPPNGYYAPDQSYSKQDYYTYYANPPPAAYQSKPAQYSSNPTQYPYHPRGLTQPATSMPSRSYNNSRARASSAYPEIEESRSRARDLRMRSRSPRPNPVRSIAHSENVNYSDPIYNLGKFNAVTETERIGDQSLPFPITLPDNLSNGQLSPRNSIQPESYFFNNRTAQKTNAGLGLRNPGTKAAHLPSADSAAAAASLTTRTPKQNSSPDFYQNRSVITKNTVPIELPVSHDDSDEEIVMSSTAYPGQEWQPAGFEQWMSY
ncbi:hypothetical protein UA08_02493 [Talaromyces atroroseus]|uniref:Uncharacterized protein n=1 Tax=Talaromyces atroroseus TaxID=1441469 RepID=A0A225AL69_TALAT|nr:hypothetical protein UA08_02493 [Talaromyces atroroseus]OKL62282.1 hypothetical protein UA08_02493 [Talaromyces atroroseus]